MDHNQYLVSHEFVDTSNMEHLLHDKNAKAGMTVDLSSVVSSEMSNEISSIFSSEASDDGEEKA